MRFTKRSLNRDPPWKPRALNSEGNGVETTRMIVDALRPMAEKLGLRAGTTASFPSTWTGTSHLASYLCHLRVSFFLHSKQHNCGIQTRIALRKRCEASFAIVEAGAAAVEVGGDVGGCPIISPNVYQAVGQVLSQLSRAQRATGIRRWECRRGYRPTQ